jgi:hypothetical protein
MATAIMEPETYDIVQPHSLREYADLLNDLARDIELTNIEKWTQFGKLLQNCCDEHFGSQRSKAFWKWVDRNVTVIVVGRRQGERYMDLYNNTKQIEEGRARPREKPIESIADFERGRGRQPSGLRVPKRDYQKPVEDILRRINTEALARDRMKKADELDEVRKLAKQIIDIGFKALATKLHPDKKGGSKHAMTLLNQARDRLRRAI